MTADELRAALAWLDWSQAELARRTGMTTVAVNHWCRGVRPVATWVPAYLEAVQAVRDVAQRIGACR